MRKTAKLGPPDVGILASVLLLVTVGVLLVFDASYARTGDAKWANYDVWYMAKRQMIYAAIGLAAMFMVSKVRLTTFLKITTPLLVVAVFLLIIVMIPGIGYKIYGARRWFKLGIISFQPSEIAKLALVLYLAGIFAQRKLHVRKLSSNWLAPACVIGLVSGLVFLEPDLGTTIAIVGTCFIMLVAAGAMKRHIFALGGCGVGLVGLAVLAEPYRMDRIWVWLNPWKDRYGDGYQIIHSLIALGTGGIRGMGLCEGREKLYLPAASTDFIYATLGEEAGLIGGIALLSLLLFFTYRGLDIGRRANSTYSNLIAVGVTSMISIQALINIAVVSASIPATGVPLPFISYGGSALVSMLIGTGVLLAVSRQVDVTLEGRDLYESSDNGRGDRRPHISGNKRGSSSSGRRSKRGTAVRW